MNTNQIQSALLNVSNYYTVDTINNLIHRLSNLGKDVYYNAKSKSIDIEVIEPTNILYTHNDIRAILKQWIIDLPIENWVRITICDNINYVFNITTIAVDGNTIIKLYLY